MQWSKLKSRVKDRIHPEFRERIDFHLTSYRESHDGADKVWITVDGIRVFDCKHYRHERETAYLFLDGLSGPEIKSTLRDWEIHSPRDFGTAMRLYLDMSISEALNSADPLVKAFAIVDGRAGKRTIAQLKVPDSEHTLVKAFYHLRAKQSSDVRNNTNHD